MFRVHRSSPCEKSICFVNLGISRTLLYGTDIKYNSGLRTIIMPIIRFITSKQNHSFSVS